MKKIILSIGEIVIYNNHLRIVDKSDNTYVYFRDKKIGQCNYANKGFVSKIRKTTMRKYFVGSSSGNDLYALLSLLTKDEVNIIIDLILD